MEFLKEKKVGKFKIGEIEIKDGFVDICDPGYDRDTWCALFDKQIKPGTYSCYVEVWNFPWINDDNTHKILNDYRIMYLTIVHNDYNHEIDKNKFELLSNNIGVDAGLCGFYNHKPDFTEERDWNNFWQNLNSLKEYGCTCDCGSANGITVSSGFGDGIYTVYQAKENDEVYALELCFGD